MVQNQDDDSIYLYEVDSEMFIGAHIFALQYYDLVRCFHLVCSILTTILLSGIEESIHRFHTERVSVLATSATCRSTSS